MNIKQIRAGVVGAVGLLLGAIFFVDYFNSRAPGGAVLTHGQVVDRATTKMLFATRPLLTIRLNDAKTEVQAVLSTNAAQDMPDDVSFYYSGDPTREVFLQQETNPLWIALMFFALAAGLLFYALRPWISKA